MKIGKYIKSVRKKLGMTQDQLAKKLKKSRPVVTKYERDQIMPPADVLLKIQSMEKNNE